VHGLCKGLAARGHSVFVATTSRDGDSDSDVPLNTDVVLDGVVVRYFASRWGRRLYFSLPLRRYLAEQVGSWDLIHSHSVFLWPTTIAARLARGAGKPYVLSPRGMLVPQLLDRKSRHFKRAWIRLFERDNVNLASAVHVTSDQERDDLMSAGFRPRETIEIPNGFDPPGSEPLQSRRRTDLPSSYALFLGRITWKKGLDRLVTALRYAPGMHLVVAGNDDEGYWPEVMRIAEDCGVSDRIHYVGYVDGSAKVALISQALLLALPSYSENFGNVVLEAMALGVPPVVSPEVGAASLVSESGGGFVVSGDPPAFGAALAKLGSSAAMRSEMAAKARTFSKKLSWDAIASRFETEYQRIVSARRR
jgi:glycosyltransferase involved in cell wall biosynthesis